MTMKRPRPQLVLDESGELSQASRPGLSAQIFCTAELVLLLPIKESNSSAHPESFVSIDHSAWINSAQTERVKKKR
jgi:hypothetical protein